MRNECDESFMSLRAVALLQSTFPRGHIVILSQVVFEPMSRHLLVHV